MQNEKSDNRLEKYAALIRDEDIEIFEYEPGIDRIRLYNAEFQLTKDWTGYLRQVEASFQMSREDCSRFVKFCREWSKGRIEVGILEEGDRISRKVLHKVPMKDEADGRQYLLGWMKDVTVEREREKEVEECAMRDSMTGLYNHSYGKELINEYLGSKTPYSSCGMMVIDVDLIMLLKPHILHRLHQLRRPPDQTEASGTGRDYKDYFCISFKETGDEWLQCRCSDSS